MEVEVDPPVPLPALTLEKSASIDVVEPGEVFTYTINYANDGAVDATGVVITDTLDGRLNPVSATGGGITAGQVVTWNIGTVRPNTGGSLVVEVEVGSVSDGVLLPNGARLTSNEVADVAAEPVGVTVTTNPLLNLQMAAAEAFVDAGAYAVFTISYENIGTGVATGVKLQNTLPAGLTLVSDSGNGQVSGSLVTWNLPDLAAGQSGSVSLNASVDTPVADGTELINEAAITFDQQAPSPIVADAVATVVSGPALEIVKTASANVVEAGETLTYTLTYRNTGFDVATPLVIVDDLPYQAQIVSASPAPASVSNGLAFWDLGELPAGGEGSIKVTVAVDSPLPNGTALLNAAYALANGVDAVSDAVFTLVASEPVLEISKQASALDVQPGDTLTYKISYGNSGTDIAPNAVIFDILPGDVTFVTASGNGNYVQSSNSVGWSLGDLAAGAQGSQTVKVQVNGLLPDGTKLVNTSAILAKGTQSQTAQSTANVSSNPDLALTVSSNPERVVLAGQTVGYSLQLANRGSDVARNTRVIDQLSPGSAPSVIGQGGRYDAAKGTITWNVVSLAPGATQVFDYSVPVAVGIPNGTELINTASAVADNAANVSAVSVVEVSSSPRLALSLNGPAGASPGDTLVYTLSYSNTGNAVAADVSLTSPVTSPLDFVSASDGGSETGAVVTWDLGDIPVGGSGFVELLLQVPVGTPGDTSVIAKASIGASGTAPVSDSLVTKLKSQAELEVRIQATPDPVPAGGGAVFEVTLSNSGNADATSVQLAASVPPSSSFVLASDGGAYDNTTEFVGWAIGTLAAGDTLTRSFTVTAPNIAFNGATLSSLVGLDADNAAAVSDATGVRVSSSPLLIGGIGSPASEALLGEIVAFDVELANVGSAPATSLAVVEQLPNNVDILTANSGGIIDAGARTVSWDLGDFSPSDGVASLVVEVRTLSLTPTIEAVATVTYDPSESADISASLPVRAPAPGNVPELTIGASVLDFGDVESGGRSTVKTVILSNTGIAPLDIAGITSANAPFALTGGSCGSVPFTLASSSNCSLAYTFSPAVTGSASQVINISTNAAGSPVTLSLQGAGVDLIRSFSGPLPSGTTGTLSFITQDPRCAFVGTPQFIPASAAAGAPASLELLDGLTRFTIGGCQPGASVSVTIDYGVPVPDGTQVWKVGAPWRALATSLGATSVSYSLTDGGADDEDGTVDGTIVDPAGAGRLVGVSHPPESIPALPVWAFLLLVGLLPWLAHVGVRLFISKGRHQHSSN
ncbi:choice-of-anchor U domain-containing protein [Luminiphilus syltensis]|uniref:choice-of-anchor U domain-containing protein n=1 Tax=Luminiphilus syltensis TaxID=1341119 RepID=UPI001E341E67|nr:choice-of-anchor U domain-containing protein [Luminiphilus syltensis]